MFWEMPASYDSWKTREIDQVIERRESGKMKNEGVFETLCGRKIRVEIEFFYLKSGNKYSYQDMSYTRFFLGEEKVGLSHPLIERYEDELSELVDCLVNERIAEEA